MSNILMILSIITYSDTLNGFKIFIKCNIFEFYKNIVGKYLFPCTDKGWGRRGNLGFPTPWFPYSSISSSP
jgi:hypothetical protein